MHKRRTPILSIVTLLSICLTATAAVSQTKPTTTNPREKAAPVVAKAIPPIKCTAPASMAACKSFKQLVEARDERILKILGGSQLRELHVGTTIYNFSPSKYWRHVAYVCLKQTSDKFMTVDFDLPRGIAYKPYSHYLSWEVGRMSSEALAFLGPPTPNHPVAPIIQDQWFNEHLDSEVYDFGGVDVHEYRNGLHADWVSDYGKWSRPSETQNDPAHDDDANFEGAYVWLAEHTGVDKDTPDIGDDPEHAHITIGPSIISVSYRFENNGGGKTNYGLMIQKSTGRFTETFSSSNVDAFEHAGTCMMLKQ
jgi:hypothetical protein